MNNHQRTALHHHCRFAFETAQPRYAFLDGKASVILTVNSGYEGIEQNYGGPVWHVSAAPLRGNKLIGKRELLRIAMRHLAGCGDRTAGEWEEYTGYAYHVRRRLTPEEEQHTGPAIDLRGKLEALVRYQTAKPNLPAAAVRLALEELGEQACEQAKRGAKPMREALRENAQQLSGICAIMALRKSLDCNSYEWLMELLTRYPFHVVEFSTFGVCWGTLAPRYNTVFWEVRAYG